MGDVIVKYNNIELSPTPLVSRSYQLIDLGGRYGQIETIDLSCYLTGIGPDYRTTIASLNTIFSGQFKTLEVSEAGVGVIYSWPNIVLQEISIPQNSFVPNGFTTYTAKLISYQIPSGVTDPINEYSFSQAEDGIVTVNHKVSAKGIRTSNSPLDNAITFVNNFIRKNPYTDCTPMFIQNSSGILMSSSETIDRANGTYGVNEVYKYVTGAGATPYLKTSSLTINDSPTNEYTNLDFSISLQGSPVDNNILTLQAAALALDIKSVLSSDYGISTTNIHRDTYSVNQNSGAALIEIKSTLISGVDTDISGYFDYNISLERDTVSNLTTWKVDGEYLTRGPMNFKKTQIASFKTANQTSGFVPYLKGIITGSPLFASYSSGYDLTLMQVNINEDTGRAVLKLSSAFSDYDTISGFVKPKYEVNVEPSRWIYELIPAANIEGHYIIQDLQMRNQAKITLNFESVITGESDRNYSIINGLLNTLSGIYVTQNSFLVGESISSGISNISVNMDLIGKDTMTDSFLTTKAYGGISNDYTRKAGFKFGY